jgi:hypothetical protein
MAGASTFELAGLLTHLVVLAVGVGGSVGVLPLARRRRSGLGLILMALSMTILILQPRWGLDEWAAVVYVLGFMVALWLLIGPARFAQSGRREA